MWWAPLFVEHCTETDLPLHCSPTLRDCPLEIPNISMTAAFWYLGHMKPANISYYICLLSQWKGNLLVDAEGTSHFSQRLHTESQFQANVLYFYFLQNFWILLQFYFTEKCHMVPGSSLGTTRNLRKSIRKKTWRNHGRRKLEESLAGYSRG